MTLGHHRRVTGRFPTINERVQRKHNLDRKFRKLSKFLESYQNLSDKLIKFKMHPTKTNTKMFIILGSQYRGVEYGSSISNAVLISKLGRQILGLPKESIQVFIPKIPNFISRSSAIRLRFRDNLYSTFSSIDEVDVTETTNKDEIINKIKSLVDPDTYPFFFFMDNGNIESSGVDIIFENEEFHTLLKSLDNQPKRMYIHSCCSGSIVDFEKICHILSKSNLYDFFENESFDAFWLKFVEEKSSKDLYDALDYFKDFDLNFSRTTIKQLADDCLTLSNVLKKEDYIFGYLSITLRRNIITYSDINNIENSSDFDEALSKAQPSSRIMMKIFKSQGITSPQEIARLLDLDTSLYNSETKINFQVLSHFFKVADFLSSSQPIDLFKLQRISSNMRSFVKQFRSLGYIPRIVYENAFKFVRRLHQESKSIEEIKAALTLTDTKILSSSQSFTKPASYQDSLYIKGRNPNDSMSWQNDPVTCEYIYQMFTSISGIDLHTIADLVKPMRNIVRARNGDLLFQVPQYFQTEKVSNDSLLHILSENDKEITIYDMIKECGYSPKEFYRSYLVYLPPMKFEMLPAGEGEKALHETRSDADKKPVTYTMRTKFSDEYTIVGTVKSDWIRIRERDTISYASTDSIKWEKPPQEEQSPEEEQPPQEDHFLELFLKNLKDVSYDFELDLDQLISIKSMISKDKTSELGITEDDIDELLLEYWRKILIKRKREPPVSIDQMRLERIKRWYNYPDFNKIRNFPSAPDDKFPPLDGGPFDIRFLKIGKNGKCGYLNLNVMDDDENKEWLIVYNTVRLFSFHLKEIDINFDFKFDFVPKLDITDELTGEALHTCAQSGDRIFGVYRNFIPMIGKQLIDIFDNNKEKNKEMSAIFHRSSREAIFFVKKNFKRVMEPLAAYRWQLTGHRSDPSELVNPENNLIPIEKPDFQY